MATNRELYGRSKITANTSPNIPTSHISLQCLSIVLCLVTICVASAMVARTSSRVLPSTGLSFPKHVVCLVKGGALD